MFFDSAAHRLMTLKPASVSTGIRCSMIRCRYFRPWPVTRPSAHDLGERYFTFKLAPKLIGYAASAPDPSPDLTCDLWQPLGTKHQQGYDEEQ